MPSLLALAGPKHGSAAGLATGVQAGGTADNRYFDTVNGIAVVDAGSGDYWFDLSGAAAVREVRWAASNGPGVLDSGKTTVVLGYRLRFNGALPSGDTILLGVQSNSTHDGALIYRSSGTKLVVQIDGTNDVGSFTIAADTNYWIDVKVDFTGATTTMDWQVNGAAQTQATVSQTTTVFGVVFGWEVSQSAPVRMQDLLISTTAADYPLGEHKVVLLSTDPAGTLTVNGATTNWSTFTNNGTINSTWNATTARNAIDEVPPTIGATADGFVQDTASTTAYVEIPMTTYTLQAGESVSGARMASPAWDSSATNTNQFGYRSWNGATERTLFAAGDRLADTSTTSPAWVCKMLTLADIDTQTELDALAIRVGFSNDISPLPGIHAMYVELAVKLGSASTDLVIANAAHGQTADTLPLTQVHALGVQAATHAQTAGTPTLTVPGTDLVIANAAHAHTAQNQTLTQVHSLTVAGATHGQTASNVALTQAHQLVVQAAAHSQQAGSLTLGQIHQLTVAAATHGQTADNLSLAGGASLTIASAIHAQTVGALTLTQVHQLAVAVALHGQTVAQLALTQLHQLVVQAATHAQQSDTIVLHEIGPLPQVGSWDVAGAALAVHETAGASSGIRETAGALAGSHEGA